MAMRAAGGLLCSLMCLYWWFVTTAGSTTSGLGFRILLVFGMCASVAATIAVLRRPSAPRDLALRATAIAAGVLALGGPLLLDRWIRADGARYVWIIHQGHPCDTMGGGPGGLWVAGTSLAFAVGAFAVGLSGRTSLAPWGAGLAGGFVLLALLVVAMFPAPAVFAGILGC